MDPNQQPPAPQKLIDFNKELEELCKKYQYEIKPALEFDPFRGLFPVMKALDISPKAAEGVPLSPTPTDPIPAAPTPDQAPVVNQPELATGQGEIKKNPEDLNETVNPSPSIANEAVDKPAAN